MFNSLIYIFIAPLIYVIALNLIGFLITWFIKKEILTDMTYALGFVGGVCLVVFVPDRPISTYQILITVVICLWGLRLGVFLMTRVIIKRKDGRFDKMRNSFWKLATFWILQAIFTWLISLSFYLIGWEQNALRENPYVIAGYVLLGLACLSSLLEGISDYQKLIFNLKNKNRFINIGLWKYSRHPNYFFEIAFWWMVSLSVILVSTSLLSLIGLISPVAITLLLYKMSGLPIIERRSWVKFGSEQPYVDYINSTPTLIPLVGRKGIKEVWKQPKN